MLVTVAQNTVMVASNGAAIPTASERIGLGNADRISSFLRVEYLWGTGGNAAKLTVHVYVSNDGTGWVETGVGFDATAAGTFHDVRAIHGAFVRFVFSFDPAATPTLGPAAVSFDLQALIDHA